MKKTKTLLNSTHLYCTTPSCIHTLIMVPIYGDQPILHMLVKYTSYNETVRIITTSKYNDHRNPLYNKLKIIKL